MVATNYEEKIKELITSHADTLARELLSIFSDLEKDMEAKIENLKQQLSVKNEEIASFETEIKALKEDGERKDKQLLEKDEEIKEYKEQLDGLRQEINLASDLIIEKDEEISNLKKEKERLKSELDKSNEVLNKITSQLEEVSKQYQDLSKKKDQQLDALRLLDVYIVLLEKVFNSAPHVRILFVAHGEKEEWTIPELAKATGIEPLAVRRAIFELRNAGLFSYDENTGKARLLVRLWK